MVGPGSQITAGDSRITTLVTASEQKQRFLTAQEAMTATGGQTFLEMLLLHLKSVFLTTCTSELDSP